MLWIILPLFACQDDLLKEGAVLVYESKEKDNAPAADRTTEVKGVRDGWIELTNYMFYPTAFVRTSDAGFEFRAPDYGEHVLLVYKKEAKPGETWTSKLTDVDTVQFTFEEQEEIEVPAGRFQAYRVKFTVVQKERGSVRKTSEGCVWYAPGAGLVKGWISEHTVCDPTEVSRSFALKKIETK